MTEQPQDKPEMYVITGDELDLLTETGTKLQNFGTDLLRISANAVRRPVGEESNPEDPEVPEEPPAGPRLTVGVSHVDDDQIAVAWKATAPVASYWAGRDGVDDTGYGAWGGEFAADVAGTAFDKLAPNTLYNISVKATYTDGTSETVGIQQRTGMAPIVEPPVVTGRKIPLIGRSGTGTNVIVFQRGLDSPAAEGEPSSVARLAAWETARGIKVDGIMSYVWRDNEDAFLNPEYWKAMGEHAKTGRLVVIKLPWAPENEGAGMNKKCADGGYVTLHKKIAGLMLQYGLNVPNVVLGWCWEWNGTWYKWSVNNGGAATFKAAWGKTWSTFQEAGVTQPRWVLTANKGPQSNLQTATSEVYVEGKMDCLGLDHYNFWPSQNNEAGFKAASEQVPGLISQRELARAHGIQWSWDEGGPANPAGSNYGGDGAYFAQAVVNDVAANKSDCAYFTIYDDQGAPESLEHRLDRNPNWKKAVIGAVKSGW